ncbi:ParB/RepB/Spo0J family partition protein [Pseudomonas putida]|nr:ParB/RepB/Spo0J family partition protein [Pseudomonas putida]
MAGDKTRPLGRDPIALGGESEPSKVGASLEDLLTKQGLLDEGTPQAADSPEPNAEAENSVPAPAFVHRKISVDAIDVSPYQPRKEFDVEKLSLLADAIQASGLLNPILVRPSQSPGRYELVGGERRWRAAKILKWQEIDARIKNLTDAEAQLAAVTDNEGDPLSDFERARAFQQVLNDNPSWSQAMLARQVGVSTATMTRCMSYFKLPAGVLAILDDKPRLIGTRAVAEFASFSPEHHDLVVQGVELIDQGKKNQQTALRWIRAKVNALLAPAPSRPEVNHLIANGEVVGKIKVKDHGVEIICEKGVNPAEFAALVRKLLANQPIELASEE